MKKIMWDKGHQNTTYDQGAAGNGLREADLVEKIVDYAIAYLDANYTGFEQRCTRENDEVLALEKRDDEADAWKADVFVSSHINAGGGHGYESYIYNKLSGRSLQEATALQNIMDNEILATMRQFGDIKAHGGDSSRAAAFFVLKETDMTAILTENLYIDSSDATYLKREDFLKAVGEAHARGVAKFLGLPTKQVNAAQAEPEPESQKEDIMNQKFEPSNLALKKAVSGVLLGFENKDPDFSRKWRWKFENGLMPISDAIALLYTAFDRGYIPRK